MKKVGLVVKKKGCEQLIVTVVVEKDDGTELKCDIDLGGNCTSAACWGAKQAVKAINELLQQK